MKELRLMKGNEAMAEAMIRAGYDGYFGYPITPQSEVMEYLQAERPMERTGMVVLQAESEVASINMLYGGAGSGKNVVTSSSSPGISLMQEGLSYIAGAELPCLVINVQRGGPGLGDIQPAQADYFQAVKGGGHGDYKLIVIAPASVQESSDFVKLALELSNKYRNPVMILTDGAIGQMMEKVELFPHQPRWTIEEIKEKKPWATFGKPADGERRIITSLDLLPEKLEAHNTHLQEKYRTIEKNEVRYEEIMCEDAEYIFVAYGLASRICQKTIQLLRDKGIKVGIVRPITLYPFPKDILKSYASKVKGFFVVEMNAGQMVEDVQLAVECKEKVGFYGRTGGVLPTPEEVMEAFEKSFK
ncbi:MAG: 3-methyl-2-oxobutanoate dehydrogenase subunit VorB [Bacteroidales bacterium]|nr:3-methyl-2-oxobutanoate dehydrogenase subunit VorB [Bacteroidales bacterium]